MKSFIPVAVLIAASPFTRAVAALPCDPKSHTAVCGLENAEDLVRLAGTPWIVASHRNFEMSPPFKASLGPVMAVRADTHEVRTLYPSLDSTVDWDRKLYPDCEAPPREISSHGLNVAPLGRGTYRLYVANHGERQSVEIIDIAVKGEQLKTRWRGCLRAPDKLFPNSVVALADGAVALSGFGVAIWKPARGWSAVMDIKGSNGIEASHDGRWLWVADDGSQSVIRIATNGTGERKRIALDFLPDNLRWGEDGKLYVAGPFAQRG